MPPAISALTDSELRRTFNSGAMTRGKAYAAARRVTVLSDNPERASASGSVRGSGRGMYTTTVQVHTSATGVRIMASCSCPVGVSCKHAVALILTLREPRPVSAVHHDWSRPQARPPEPSWRSTLAPLVGSGQTRQSAEWAVAIDVTQTHYQSRMLLSARPMRRGKKGQWIKTGATWNDVAAAARSGQITDRQAMVLVELEAAVTTDYAYSRLSDGSIDLSALTRAAWRVFNRLDEAGVTLLGPHRGEVAVWQTPLAAAVSIVPGAEGALKVSAQLSDPLFEEARVDGRLMVIGSPAHGLAVWDDDDDPTRLWLAPFAEPLDRALESLVNNAVGVTVPESDVHEFLHEFYPRLRRALGTVHVDSQIAIPEVVPPQLSLTLTHDGLAVQLAWGFAYQVDGEAVRVAWGQGRESFRDPAAEWDLVNEFTAPAGLPVNVDASGKMSLSPTAQLDGYPAVVLSEDVVPQLKAAGVDVQTRGARPDYKLANVAPVVHISVEDGENPQSDWYDLAVTVKIDGETVHFGPLFAALAAGETHLVLLSGTYLPLDRPEFLTLRELIMEARELSDRRSQSLRVNRFHTGIWEDLISLGVVDHQSSKWQSAVGSLSTVEEIAVPDLPDGLKAELRPYQRDGYAWLTFLVDHDLGGILADDMGLGKTVQALAMIVRQVSRGSDPFLVVAPTSVVSNWAHEAEKFAPDLKVVTVTASRSRRGTELADAIAGADLVITSYALFRIENDAYLDQRWAGLLLDEAQFVKNHQGKTYQCARRLNAPFKLAITGTPLENSLMDLWAMLSIVAPGLYPDPKRFAESYQRPIEAGHGKEQLALLQRRIRPLMRRRTKDEVASDLPPKTEQVLEVALSPKHARIYQTHLQRERQKVMGLLADDSATNRFEVLASLTKLRLMSLDPGLVDDQYADVGSAKIDVLMEHLEEVTAEGHRVLVFSQFTTYLQRVRSRLDEAGISHAYLDGRTRNRAAAIEQFTSGERPVFVISLKAGGFGLNLTEADYCYVLDPWWNPATEAQAVDRAHRIGQTRPVMVYRLVSADTIEQKVMELKARKSQLFDAVMDDGAELSGSLSHDDIRGLLGG